MGKFTFTPPSLDQDSKKQKKTSYIKWEYTIGSENSEASLSPLLYLQSYQCAVHMKSELGEWRGICTVDRYAVVPTVDVASNSVLKGSLTFSEVEEKLLALTELWMKTLKNQQLTVQVDLEILQGELPPS